MRYFLSSILLFTIHLAVSQVPRVPGSIQFADLKLKISENARIDIQRDVNNLHKSPKYFEIKAERARTYFPIIERIFEAEGIPDEIKYLVLQESALISDAVSSAKAVGFWQLKDFTAMELGLRVDRNIDERKNIVASTYAAARYFKKANEVFDNWLFSVQSYQMGIGGASRTLSESGYGKKRITINRNTYWYVKKYLAYLIAFDGYVDKEPIQKITEYQYGAGKSIRSIARETGFDEDELEKYNKWLLRGKIPDDRPYTVILPGVYETKYVALNDKNKKKEIHIPEFKSQSIIFPKLRHSKYKDHKYIIGVNGLPGIIASDSDNARTLAAKGGISLRKFNLYNDLSARQTIKPGQVYYLKRKKNKAGTHYHTMQGNESLWQVAQKYGIKLDKLLQKNRIENPEKVKPGRVLWLRFIRPRKVAIAYSKIEEASPGVDEDASVLIDKTLAKNESNTKNTEPIQPAEILKTTQSEEIKPANNNDKSNNASENQPEQKVTGRKVNDKNKSETDSKETIGKESIEKEVEKRGENEDKINEKVKTEEKNRKPENYEEIEDPPAEIIYPTAGKKRTVHAVKKGETFYSISNYYGIPVPALLQWNELKINDIIYVGQRLVVYTDKHSSGSIIHKVRAGETMYKIARQYGVTIDQLLQWNNKLDYHLKVGEELRIINTR